MQTADVLLLASHPLSMFSDNRSSCLTDWTSDVTYSPPPPPPPGTDDVTDKIRLPKFLKYEDFLTCFPVRSLTFTSFIRHTIEITFCVLLLLSYSTALWSARWVPVLRSLPLSGTISYMTQYPRPGDTWWLFVPPGTQFEWLERKAPSALPLLSLCLYQVLSLFFCVFIFGFIFRFWQLTSVSFSVLLSSIRAVLNCFLPRRKINGRPTRRTRGT
jgi:hypothetical protein